MGQRLYRMSAAERLYRLPLVGRGDIASDCRGSRSLYPHSHSGERRALADVRPVQLERPAVTSAGL